VFKKAKKLGDGKRNMDNKDDYLEEVFITADKGIQKKTITAGGTTKPEKGDKVTITYQGRL